MAIARRFVLTNASRAKNEGSIRGRGRGPLVSVFKVIQSSVIAVVVAVTFFNKNFDNRKLKHLKHKTQYRP